MAHSSSQGILARGLFGDPEIAELWSDEAVVGRMIRCEQALAKVQGDLGVIPGEGADAIVSGLQNATVDLEELAGGLASDGVVVPALVKALRRALPADAAQWLHWGATSQDIVDTALVLGLRDCLDILATRLGQLIDALQEKSADYAETVMAARTRAQMATPITFGLRIAQWAQPLIELESATPQLRADLLRVQFGGASGANTAVAPHGTAIAEAIGRELDLAAAAPWHTNRRGIVAFAAWLTQVSSALAKLSGDLVLLSRAEIGEVSLGAGGGSSTMPQKSNPVGPETILALCDVARAAAGGLLATSDHAEERDGAKWAAEWILLPQLVSSAGAALRRAVDEVGNFDANPERMLANMSAHPGVFAEQASFVLARHMPRTEAQALVKRALAAGVPLTDALSTLCPPGIDWEGALAPEFAVEPSKAVASRIFAARNPL